MYFITSVSYTHLGTAYPGGIPAGMPCTRDLQSAFICGGTFPTGYPCRYQKGQKNGTGTDQIHSHGRSWKELH